jgi:hypothetical protein
MTLYSFIILSHLIGEMDANACTFPIRVVGNSEILSKNPASVEDMMRETEKPYDNKPRPFRPKNAPDHGQEIIIKAHLLVIGAAIKNSLFPISRAPSMSPALTTLTQTQIENLLARLTALQSRKDLPASVRNFAQQTVNGLRAQISTASDRRAANGYNFFTLNAILNPK